MSDDGAADNRHLVIDLLNVVEELLAAHGYLSDPECERVDCECHACLTARELLQRIGSAKR